MDVSVCTSYMIETHSFADRDSQDHLLSSCSEASVGVVGTGTESDLETPSR